VKITTSISLPNPQEKELASILGCSQADLSETLGAYASAGLIELLTMILGQKVFKRGSDILEYRLFLLIQSVFEGQIPSEQDVSRLFQLSATGSRSLLRAVMSKYQYQLQGEIIASLQNLLKNATKGDDDVRTISVYNLNLVDELNRRLAEIDPTLPPVAKSRGSVSTYQVAASSFAKLSEKLAD